MKKKWLSVHIYYGERCETLLRKVVKPFVEKLQSENQIKSYFFIRYWEGGPHIRLRIQGDPNILDEQVKPCLLATTSRYMKDYPSTRQEPEWIKALPPNQRWYPNNSIQFIKYEPEVSRYGGGHAIGLAEEHFKHSSDTVLTMISSDNKWDYDRALGAALQLHLSFVQAIGLNVSQAEILFNRMYSSWLPRIHKMVLGLSKQEEDPFTEKTLAAFKETFDKQKKLLLPFIVDFWERLREGDSFDEKWLDTWIGNVRITDEQYKTLQEKARVSPAFPIHMIGTPKSFEKKVLERWSIYQSFIHMTNNRLGIFNHDEGYLCYILTKSFRYVSQQFP